MEPRLYPLAQFTPDVAIFPLYNFGYKRTGYHQYRPAGEKKLQNDPEGKYYTYVRHGEVGLFGLESLDFSNTIFLVSGVFKAATLHRLGFTALHISIVSHHHLLPQLKLLRRSYIAIGDNDDEGRQFARRYGGFTSPCDIDEMTDEAVLEMISGK